ncbi:myosin-IIIa-like [Discoglossus pictus]
MIPCLGYIVEHHKRNNEYLNEDVDAKVIEYEDNRPLLDMFLQKPMGLLSLLDEEIRFPRATDQTLVEKFEDNLKSKYFWRPKRVDLTFGIHHYAGKVLYNASGFLEKNRDTLPADIVLLLRSSENNLIRILVTNPLTKTGNLAHTKAKGGKNSHSWTKQKSSSRNTYSLMDLLSKMVAGQPHFVRCIKPNNDRLANKFDREKVLVQLRYTGILETARIRRLGYSHRILFANFIKRYHLVCFKSNEDPPVSPECCVSILEKANLDNWVLGKTKVFLKYYHVEQLNRMVKTIVDRIVLLQACVKGWLGAKRYQKLQYKREQSAVKIQSAYRGYTVRKETKHTKDEMLEIFITRFQALARGYIVRKKRNELLQEETEAATKIQSHYRGFKERKSFQRKRESMKRKQSENPDDKTGNDEPDEKNEENKIPPVKSEEDAAVVIQSHFRGHKERKKLKEGHEKLPGEEELQVKNEEIEDSSANGMEQDAKMDVEEKGNESSSEEDKAAIIIQSNYRGHRDRKKFQEEKNNITTENNHHASQSNESDTEQNINEGIQESTSETFSEKESDKTASVGDTTHNKLENGIPIESCESTIKAHQDDVTSPETPQDKEENIGTQENDGDLEKAAVVIQSNYRGLREREKLKKEGKLQNKKNNVEKENGDADLTLQLLKEIDDMAFFTEQISKLSENYLTLQQRLNDLIMSNQLKPENTAEYLRGKNTVETSNENELAVSTKIEDVKPQRVPRRQKPKTLYDTDDSTYYNLLHLPLKDEKRKPRKESPGKVLDSEDYYKEIYSNHSVSKNNQSMQEGVSAMELLTQDESSSVPEEPPGEAEMEGNPYDYRKLLRKTSQRERLIQHF